MPTSNLDPNNMSLEELLEAEKTRPPLTDAEKKEQILAIVAAEDRRNGHNSTEADIEADVEAALNLAKVG